MMRKKGTVIDEDRVVRYVIRDVGGLFLMKRTRRTGVVSLSSDVSQAVWYKRPGNALNAIERIAPLRARSLRVVRLDIFLTTEIL